MLCEAPDIDIDFFNLEKIYNTLKKLWKS
jgi:hypothetical protein